MQGRILHKPLWELRVLFANKNQFSKEDIIDFFLLELKEKIQNNIIGIYIIGSITQNDYNRQISDIDFVVVTKNELDKNKLVQLSTLHKKISSKATLPSLNGIYMPLGIFNNPREKKHLVYYNCGQLLYRSQLDKGHVITLLELKNNAIVINGLSNKKLPITLNKKDIIDYTIHNTNNYWCNWVKMCKNPFSLLYYVTILRSKEVVWGITGMARQLYTFSKHAIASKTEACEFCAINYPTHSKMLRFAIEYRRQPLSRISHSKKKMMLSFIEFGIRTINEANT